jgi:plasmid stabilization system protein ParE
MRKVVYHPHVPSEIRELLAYYEEANPDLGDRFWNEIISAIEYARRFPERHHFELIGVGLRRSNLKAFPIHILFRVFPTHIRITVARHDRRHPSFGVRRK